MVPPWGRRRPLVALKWQPANPSCPPAPHEGLAKKCLASGKAAVVARCCGTWHGEPLVSSSAATTTVKKLDEIETCVACTRACDPIAAIEDQLERPQGVEWSRAVPPVGREGEAEHEDVRGPLVPSPRGRRRLLERECIDWRGQAIGEASWCGQLLGSIHGDRRNGRRSANSMRSSLKKKTSYSKTVM